MAARRRRALLDQARLRRRATRPDPDEVRVRLHPRRLRHQGGLGADPFLASGRAQPGAGAGFGDVLGLPPEHRALLHHALRPAGPARARTAIHQRAADPVRHAVDTGRRRIHCFPEGREAAPRLSQRRAHGNHHPRLRAGPLGQLCGAVPYAEPFRLQVLGILRRGTARPGFRQP